jgi:hypothetical protein
VQPPHEAVQPKAEGGTVADDVPAWRFERTLRFFRVSRERTSAGFLEVFMLVS